MAGSPRRAAVLADGDTVLVIRGDATKADYVEARITALQRNSGSAKVKFVSDGTDSTVALSELLPFSYPTNRLAELHDLSTMSETGPAAAVFSLSQRFRQGLHCTKVGPMLVSVNPYQWREFPKGAPRAHDVAQSAFDSLYPAEPGAEHADRTVVVVTGQSGAGKTEAAKMVLSKLTKLIGKRGSSGKSSSAGDSAADVLGPKLAAANTILETFGNAGTGLNDNSSRFAKYVDVELNAEGSAVAQCTMECFLLETSRVVRRGPGEHPFHSFNLLFSNDGLTPDERKELDVWDPLLFSAMASSGGSSGASASSRAPKSPFSMQEVRDALTSVGMTTSDQNGVLRILAAILHLMNVGFESADTHSPVTATNRQALERAAQLLGFGDGSSEATNPPLPKLEDALTSVTLVVGGKSQVKRLAKGAAVASRDTMAKLLYEALFKRLLSAIHTSLNSGADGASSGSSPQQRRMTTTRTTGGGHRKSFGVLDIFGFEAADGALQQLASRGGLRSTKGPHSPTSPPSSPNAPTTPAGVVNDLEQLLINFTNELVQNVYDSDVLGQMAFEAEAEGVVLPADAKEGEAVEEEDLWAAAGANKGKSASEEDAAATQAVAGLSPELRRARLVDAMTHKVHGILNVISDESALGQQGTVAAAAANLVDKVMALGKAFPDVLRRDKTRPNVFRLKHFCAVLDYTVDQFTTKNRIHGGASHMLKQSGDPFITSLVTEFDTARHQQQRTASRGAATSQITAYREQLDSLVGILKSSSLHWIRCVKPNLTKTPGVWQSHLVLQQLSSCGVLRSLEQLGGGFSVRQPYKDIAALAVPAAMASVASNRSSSASANDVLKAFAESDSSAVVAALARAVPSLGNGAMLLGATKVFMRASTFREVRLLADSYASHVSFLWQRVGRAAAIRKGLSSEHLVVQNNRKSAMVAQRIAAEREERTALEQRRNALLISSAKQRCDAQSLINRSGGAKVAHALQLLKQTVGRLEQDLHRITNEIDAATAASTAKEATYYEYERYGRQFKQEMAAKKATEQQRKEERILQERKREMEREAHKGAAKKAADARAARDAKMAKVYLGARAIQLQAEQRAAAEEQQAQKSERARAAQKRVQSHLGLAKERLAKRDAIAAYQVDKQRAAADILGEEHMDPSVHASSIAAAEEAALDAQFQSKRELWSLLESAVSEGQAEAAGGRPWRAPDPYDTQVRGGFLRQQRQ